MREKQCLASWVSVNGLDVLILWDSGSMMSGMLPVFAQLANVKVNKLIDQHTLQLGIVESHSFVKYRVKCDLNIQGNLYPTYLDIANFDCYDIILGASYSEVNLEREDLKGNPTSKYLEKPPDKCPKELPTQSLDRNRGLMRNDLPQLWYRWLTEFSDMMQETPDQLPLFQEVNHRIHLIDENKQYTYHLPYCPHSLQDEFHAELNQYVNAR
ncbi:hypothetical protein AN958_09773 [Leucoagaricus sp. SymC.cos]|nr:hypothetical protein AN958_09773 [Leucoagaricus sp. SymC.cos]